MRLFLCQRLRERDASIFGFPAKQFVPPCSSKEDPRRITIDLTQESLEAPGWFAPLIPVPAVVPIRTEKRPFSGLGGMAESSDGHMRPLHGIVPADAVFEEGDAVTAKVVGHSNLVPGVGRDARLAELPENGIHLVFHRI